MVGALQHTGPTNHTSTASPPGERIIWHQPVATGMASTYAHESYAHLALTREPGAGCRAQVWQVLRPVQACGPSGGGECAGRPAGQAQPSGRFPAAGPCRCALHAVLTPAVWRMPTLDARYSQARCSCGGDQRVFGDVGHCWWAVMHVVLLHNTTIVLDHAATSWSRPLSGRIQLLPTACAHTDVQVTISSTPPGAHLGAKQLPECRFSV